MGKCEANSLYEMGEAVFNYHWGSIRKAFYKPTGREIVAEVYENIDRHLSEDLFECALKSSKIDTRWSAKIYNVLRKGNTVTVFREDTPGSNLLSLLEEGAEVSSEGVCDICALISEVMGGAYSVGLYKSGIYPWHVILNPANGAKVVGAGYMHLAEGAVRYNSKSTARFLSEEDSETENCTRKSDVFVLGAIAHTLAINSQIRNTAFLRVIEAATSPDIKKRFPSSRMFVEALESAFINGDMHNGVLHKMSDERFEGNKPEKERNEENANKITGSSSKGFIESDTKHEDSFAYIRGEVKRSFRENPLRIIFTALSGVLAATVIMFLAQGIFNTSFIPENACDIKEIEASEDAYQDLDIEMPELRYLTEKEALRILEDLGIEAKIEKRKSLIFPEDTVIEHEPCAGELAKRTITLVISGCEIGEESTGQGAEDQGIADSAVMTDSGINEDAEIPHNRTPANEADSPRRNTAEPKKPIDDRPPENKSPNARLTASVCSGSAPLSVVFDASSSSDPCGEDLHYEWNFGDGFSLSGGSRTSHTFNPAVIPERFTVTVTVKNNQGMQSKASLTITVD